VSRRSVTVADPTLHGRLMRSERTLRNGWPATDVSALAAERIGIIELATLDPRRFPDGVSEVRRVVAPAAGSAENPAPHLPHEPRGMAHGLYIMPSQERVGSRPAGGLTPLSRTVRCL